MAFSKPAVWATAIRWCAFPPQWTLAAIGFLLAFLLGASPPLRRLKRSEILATVRILAGSESRAFLPTWLSGPGPDQLAFQALADLAATINREPPSRIVPVLGRGGIDNLMDLLALRGIDMAIFNADMLRYARVSGLAPRARSVLRAVTPLFESTVLFIGPRGERRDIRSLDDLRVGVGRPGSPTHVTAEIIFAQLEISVETVHLQDVERDAPRLLGDGTLAAAVVLTPTPAAALRSWQRLAEVDVLEVPFIPELAELYGETRVDSVESGAPLRTVAVACSLQASIGPTPASALVRCKTCSRN